MEILRPSDYDFYNFEENIISGKENIEAFYKVLRSPNTKYFWDLDQILGNSTKSVYEIFNKTNPYKINANIWEVDKLDYLTSLVENAGYLNHGDLEVNWFKNIPLYRAKRYEYSKMALDIAVKVSGIENNFILTSRLPKLERATNLWVQREFPEFDKGNILIRKKDDPRNSIDYKIESLKEHSDNNHSVVLIEDQERYINAALRADIQNLLVIGVPVGVIRYSIQDNSLLTLSRYPFKEQEMLPLYTLFQNAQNYKSEVKYSVSHNDIDSLLSL
jgi:hypothetical protein